MEMRHERDSDSWLLFDNFGTVWRLRPSGDEDMPLIIEAVLRRASVNEAYAEYDRLTAQSPAL